MKIGVMLPTHNNPLFYRMALLQMFVQTQRPDFIAVVENNHDESYAWAAKDLVEQLDEYGTEVYCTHLKSLRAPAFYTEALKMLLDGSCTHFLKLDHDDFYHTTHIQSCLEKLDFGRDDYSLKRRSDVLILPYRAKPVYKPNQEFNDNPTKCPANTICFNRPFAEDYFKELEAAVTNGTPDDNILASVMPRFKGFIDETAVTTCYVSHGTNTSTANWAEDERWRQQKER